MWPPNMFRNNSANRNFFIRNGEILLRLQISFSQGQSNPIRIYNLGEIQKATDSFDPSRRLPPGYSAYYWGILDDRKVVVKNWNEISTSENDDYIVEALTTEIVVLSNTTHRNVVKLLGCCLETRVPLLVYLFIPSGNLRQTMQLWVSRRVEAPPLSTRLQIAIDVAAALTYLHSYASRPIVHRGVHAGAVILGEGYTATLAGFSHSVPIPVGEAHVAEDRITRSRRLIDPEYATTGVVTEKVDTYAFGVLLLELLVGVRFSDYFHGDGKDRLLDVLREKEECMARFVADAAALGDDGGKADHIRASAELALRCARPRTQERPTMKDVVEELRRIRRTTLP